MKAGNQPIPGTVSISDSKYWASSCRLHRVSILHGNIGTVLDTGVR